PSASATAAPAAAAAGRPAFSPDKPISPLLRSGRIPGTPQPVQSEDISRILNIEVPIIVQLSERTMPLSEILNLTTGSIIEFDKPADSELELRVNNKCIGSGQAVKVGENFGLRVVRIGSLRERIKALGES
ncbi:MAG TPA: FliM/FliN family flagellar motor switch protein, partial [Phycisphaerae bacterium]|nr:FliM/FliN family flagellar motor switch protein [Phycisphaerae bacterium]